MEAIILAGGYGTRLRSEVADLPKSMALVYGEPFLNYQIRFLKSQGVSKIILAVGYLKEIIMEYYQSQFEGIGIEYSIEDEPLGTGGAILQALEMCENENVFVLNGDTMMMTDLVEMNKIHTSNGSNISLSLKPMSNFSRYGSVVLGSNNRILAFKEKKFTASGFINTGVYLIQKSWIRSLSLPTRFSFEKDVLEALVDSSSFYAFTNTAYFIDIGIPEDYKQAQKDFAAIFPINFKSFDTMFLDRDGVLNRHLPGDYVTSIEKLDILPGVFDFLKKAKSLFRHIIIVTNQQGVGKNRMTLKDLAAIHSFMVNIIEKNGGRIDKIYSATELESPNNFDRKPNIGMALKAKEDFPEIDFSRSVMIGDSDSDIEFGKNIGAFNIRLSKVWDKRADKTFGSLEEFAKYLD